jgi:hypothetical protein
MDELEAMVEREPVEAWLDRALATIADIRDPSKLEELAAWAQGWADGHASSMRSGALLMIAGAAAAKAHVLTARDRPQAAPAIESFDALQREIDGGRSAKELLPRFAQLAAALVDRDVPPYFDMQVDTRDDDTVFHWTSGVMALRARSRHRYNSRSAAADNDSRS